MTNKDITKAYVGNTAITAMYLGDTKIWPNQPIMFRPKVGDFVYGDKTWSTELDSSKTCVGVITDVRSRDFDFIALHESDNIISWSKNSILVNNVFTATDIQLAYIDFGGKKNTEAIVSQLGLSNSEAVNYCNNYTTEGFTAGSWYLPSFGQWEVAYYNKSAINAAIAKTTGSAINEDSEYWTSTQYNADNAYIFDWANGNSSSAEKVIYLQYVRPFCTYEYNPIPNGVYICDYSGNHYTTEEWVNSGRPSSDAIGVGVATDDTAFMVSSTNLISSLSWGNNVDVNIPFNSVSYETYLPQLFHGKAYTDYMIPLLTNSAAEHCMDAVAPGFPKGSAYLPATGELNELYTNLSTVNVALELIGGIAIQGNNVWSSIAGGAQYAYCMDKATGSALFNRTTVKSVLPFFPFPFKGGMEEGVYILDKNNKLYEKDHYSGTSDDAVGVAVMLSGSQFVVSKTADTVGRAWTNSGQLIDGIVTTTNSSLAMEDFAGESNTDKLIEQMGSNAPAAYHCRTTSGLFPEGYMGYLPSLGELTLAYYYKDQIDTCMSKIGGNYIHDSYVNWSSTQRDSSNAWYLTNSNGNPSYGIKTTVDYVRAFAPINLSKITVA